MKQYPLNCLQCFKKKKKKHFTSLSFQVNIVFFLITVWKLAQKFSSLNPDLDNLQKIKWVSVSYVRMDEVCMCA